jgi:hypothetical protein
LPYPVAPLPIAQSLLPARRAVAIIVDNGKTPAHQQWQ